MSGRAPALSGWRVLVGRPTARGSSLIAALAMEGAAAQSVPLIQIVPPQDSAELDAIVLALASGDGDWVAFTSVNAVAATIERARALDIAVPIPAGVRVAAVGPATAAAIRQAGSAVDLMPAVGGSAAALGAIFPTAVAGQTVLLPRSEIARDTLPEMLRHLGYQVRTGVAYRTISCPLPATVAADLAAGHFEALVVTSPSGVAALAQCQVATSVAVVAIGAPTAAALTAAGLPPTATASSPTDAAVIDCLLSIRTASAAGTPSTTSGELP